MDRFLSLLRASCRVAAVWGIVFGSVVFLEVTACAADDNSAQAVRDLAVWLAAPREKRSAINDEAFTTVALTRTDAQAASAALWRDRAAFLRETRAGEMQAKVIEMDGLRMPFDWVSFSDPAAPKIQQRSLFISLHGGGNAPKEVNDSQWHHQLQLGQAYHPREGVYVAPRAPTDTWDLWHQAHVDAFLDRLIQDFVALENVNPNRVYLLGYSAGGDGVYPLAPRMADHWAAAATMAGHPNAASPLGLRNVPLAIQVGANDSAYHRNEVAAEWGKKLDDLQRADLGGYRHFTELHAGKGHWMDLEDRKAIPWMEEFTRQPWPEKIRWKQDEVTHTRFYWLARPVEEVKAGQDLRAERAGQTITLSSADAQTVTVLLNDAMLDLDQAVTVQAEGRTLFSGRASRTIGTLARTLTQRADPDLIFSAEITVTLR